MEQDNVEPKISRKMFWGRGFFFMCCGHIFFRDGPRDVDRCFYVVQWSPPKWTVLG